MPLPPLADPAEVGFDAARLARLDRHFARYVEDGRLAGWQLTVSRHGRLVHHAVHGMRDREAGLPVEPDTLWRIYSMTKPVTSVAAMSLWEEGAFQLTDEVSRFVPGFADVRVYAKGSTSAYYTEPPLEPVRVWHLLTHTSGLTYGFFNTSVVDALYRAAGYELDWPAGMDLAAACENLAGLPLLFQPGTRWGYGVSTDVLGRVLEVVAGKPLDEVLRERVLGPLGMDETRFWVEGPDLSRLAALYVPDPAEGRAVRYDELGGLVTRRPGVLSGGGGLVCTASDYDRFTRMLLHRGELEGARVLGSRTVDWMTVNHLPGLKDLGRLSTGGFAETVLDGVGFGLGFAVVEDDRPARTPSSAGQFYWGGLASTAFLVDPVEGITAQFFTQLVPSSTHPIRPQLRQILYSALVD